MTKGWKYESNRHALAARGVKTNPNEYREKSCLARVDREFEGRIEDLHKLWDAYNSGDEEVEDLGNIFEYGLAFDYVPAGTFNDQEQGYFRYQLSWGGPGDEFRFFVDPDLHVYKIEYWFLDWNDGAMKIPRGKDKELMLDIFNWFKETGTVEAELKKTMEE